VLRGIHDEYGGGTFMNASHIDLSVGEQDCSDRYVARSEEHHVVDFYRSIRPPFFGAVVSRCANSAGRPQLEPVPTLVTVLGELDVTTAPLLGDCFARIDGDVEVDCSGLEFVDARGLEVFVSACARSERNRRFVLVEPARCLLRLLRVTGLDSMFDIRRDASLVR
jgi:anti-anti-sigma factor